MELLPTDEAQRAKNKKTNKTVLKVVGAVLAVLLLLGMCGALVGDDSINATPAPAATQSAQNTVQAPAPSPTNSKPSEAVSESKALDARFNEAWANLSPKPTLTAKQGRANAKNVCRRLDNGDEVGVIFMDLLTLTKDAETTGYIMGGAAYAYCPKHKDTITDGLAELAGGN